MEFITHHRHAVNMTKPERVVSLVGGGLLALAGLRKKSPAGMAMILAGGDLLRRGITGHSYLFEFLGIRTAPTGQGAETTSVPYELGIRVDHAITIGRSRSEVYSFFRELTNLPQFMQHVQSIELLDNKMSHWVVRAPAGRTVEWDAVIHNEVENELIAWRTLPGANVDHAGAVWFKDAPEGSGTELKVELQYNPPAGIAGAVFARLWGEEPTQQISDDLRRLKQLLEAGEILTTEGQPHGAASRSSRTAQAERETGWAVEQASAESFPASDAPSYTH